MENFTIFKPLYILIIPCRDVNPDEYRCTTQDKQLLFLLSQLSPFAIGSFDIFPSVIQHLFQLFSYLILRRYVHPDEKMQCTQDR